MRREQSVRRERSGWFTLWMWCLIGWVLFGAWFVYDLGARHDAIVQAAGSTAQRAGARLGAALGYNAAINRFVVEWLAVASILGLFLAVTRGRTVIEERWVDETGRPVAPPVPQNPPRPS